MKDKSNWSSAMPIISTYVLSVVSMSVFPKFTQANYETRTSDLIDGLHQMRSQLDLYCAQHDNCYDEKGRTVWSIY
jgi:hypothetical protein